MRSTFLMLSLLLFSCGRKDEYKEMEKYFEVEINHRITALKNFQLAGDSLIIDPASINKEVDKLILLSKDIENLQACVGRSNKYFSTLSQKFSLNPSEFMPLNTGMHINEMAVILKQNELSFFNQILFKRSIVTPAMYTAQ